MNTYPYNTCTCNRPWNSITPPPPCPAHSNFTVGQTTFMWNGPICPKCGPYLGWHNCGPEYVGRHRKGDAA